MAHHQTCRALLILFTFQLYTASLNANPQTFGPLIRNRAIRDRKQSSEEDLNANIERIYRKDFKTTTPYKDLTTDEVEPSPTELVARSHVSTRTKTPIENNEQNAMMYVYRDADGKLVLKLPDPQSAPTTPHTTSYSEPPSSNENDNMLVLKYATPSNTTIPEDGDPVFADGSYPAGYPFKMIQNIIAQHRGNYEHWFDNKIKRESLTTRANSEADKFLCSSDAHTEYPTYSVKDKRYIINLNGFFQPVVYETCTNTGSNCSKSSTSSQYELICMQTYRDYKMFVAPLDVNSSKFDFIDIRYPACCKCAQVKKQTTTPPSSSTG
ncbi:uncharacterized protein LOC128718969 [Anopheles marshallii]|uniref:uncharacterized protein LOC128718969 n=1 Tax=Anopheles marshallii TaxID=1521116 RepID=UPI00237A7921|nr:uncharacterized protein LOC128718969 [Anopheles marshallii]